VEGVLPERRVPHPPLTHRGGEEGSYPAGGWPARGAGGGVWWVFVLWGPVWVGDALLDRW